MEVLFDDFIDDGMNDLSNRQLMTNEVVKWNTQWRRVENCTLGN